jgi:hypothetical protein
MNVELKRDLEHRLQEEARRRAQTVPELVEDVLTHDLDALDDSPTATVRGAQKLITRVWPIEDFSDWQPSPPTG